MQLSQMVHFEFTVLLKVFVYLLLTNRRWILAGLLNLSIVKLKPIMTVTARCHKCLLLLTCVYEQRTNKLQLWTETLLWKLLLLNYYTQYIEIENQSNLFNHICLVGVWKLRRPSWNSETHWIVQQRETASISRSVATQEAQLNKDILLAVLIALHELGAITKVLSCIIAD